MQCRYHIDVMGIVQGVGFRPYLHQLSQKLCVSGWVRNTSNGIELEIQGNDRQVKQFLTWLPVKVPPLAKIMTIQQHQVELQCIEEPGLVILPSDVTDGRTLLSPDVAVCESCLQEMKDPANRRYEYAFINCTHCGPRFSIITDLPYDRPRTTMASFLMCQDCQHEYTDTNDRRFHAQPTACAGCGPHYWFETTANTDESIHNNEALLATISMLQAGKIVAIKGLGGFHLACDATNQTAVERLRQRKHRPIKPFAVMMASLDEVVHYCHLNKLEAKLLTSKEAPIVLLRKKKRNSLATGLAPHNGYLGVMLPYTPLHHLLMQKIQVPLVMTSGNKSGEPLCIENDKAREILASYCDGFLLHDRPIYRRADDSVISDGQFIRRSRGYVPVPVLLPKQIKLPSMIAAAGGEIKNVPAVAYDQFVFLTQHIGDLTNIAMSQFHEAVISDFEQLFKINPAILVCDKHPHYISSRLARKRAASQKLQLIEVQHHHAHIAGCLAENNWHDTAFGICFDGTGYGDDGKIWGGEGLILDDNQYQRLLHLEYVPLPGGDAAIKHPYRAAISYLHQLLPSVDIQKYFPAIEPKTIQILCTMVDKKINSPECSSMGRLFDVVSALLNLCLDASYEAEAPIALEAAALEAQNKLQLSGYPIIIADSMVRLSSVLAEILHDIDIHRPTSEIAYKFHITIATMTVQMAQYLQQHIQNQGKACNHVALSGGVWQNRLLVTLTKSLLKRAGFIPLLHHQVPANDAGLAYGQIAVAAKIINDNA